VDDSDNETIYAVCADDVVVILGEVSDGDPVIVASYNEQGRMISANQISVSGATVQISGAAHVQVMWISSSDQKPKCHAIDYDQ
jgi:hypothetical protein